MRDEYYNFMHGSTITTANYHMFQRWEVGFIGLEGVILIIYTTPWQKLSHRNSRKELNLSTHWENILPTKYLFSIWNNVRKFKLLIYHIIVNYGNHLICYISINSGIIIESQTYTTYWFVKLDINSLCNCNQIIELYFEKLE